MNWLFVSTDPWPMHHGAALRIFHLARELSSLGEKVTVLSDLKDRACREAYEEIGACYEQIEPKLTPPNSSELFALNPSYAQNIKRCSKDYDVLVFFTAKLFQLVAHCSDSSQIVADFIDDPILSAKRRLMRPSSLRWAFNNLQLLFELRRYEKKYLNRADLFTFVTSKDANSFQRRNRKSRVDVVANGVDRIHCRIDPALKAPPPYVIFVGNYKFIPNQTAAEFLVHKIAPLTWKKSPEVKFVLVGSHPPSWLKDHPDKRIEATGFVDDVYPYVANAKAAIIPMVTGTGIKNKLLEAWAAQIPVVATPLACQGVNAMEGKNLLTGKNAQGLSDALIRVLTDSNMAQRLAQEGYKTVSNDFAWQQMAKKLRNNVLSLTPTGAHL